MCCLTQAFVSVVGTQTNFHLPIDVQGGMFYRNVTCGKKLRYLGVNPISTKFTFTLWDGAS